MPVHARALSLLALALALGLPAAAASSGLEGSGIGARGRAMGYAMAAAADDWTALYYNPAALARVEGRHGGCVYELFLGVTSSTASLRNLPPADGPDPSRGDFVDPIGDEPRSFSERDVGALVHAGEFGWARGGGGRGWGFGLFGSGAGSAWEDREPMSGGGALDAEISFRNVSVNVPVGGGLTVAPGLALGAAMTLRYGFLDAEYAKGRTGALPYRLESRQETRGTAVSADLGALWEPTARLALAAVWRLPYAIVKEGDTQVGNSLLPVEHSSATQVREQVPARLTVGAALRTEGDGVVSAALSLLRWSDYRRRTAYDDPLPGLLEDSGGNPFRWGDAWVANLGLELPVGKGWRGRAGIVYDQAPEPREYRTLVGGQTVDAWKVALGAGRRRAASDLDLGYTFSWAPPVEGYVDGAEYGLALHEAYVGYNW